MSLDNDSEEEETDSMGEVWRSFLVSILGSIDSVSFVRLDPVANDVISGNARGVSLSLLYEAVYIDPGGGDGRVGDTKISCCALRFASKLGSFSFIPRAVLNPLAKDGALFPKIGVIRSQVRGGDSVEDLGIVGEFDDDTVGVEGRGSAMRASALSWAVLRALSFGLMSFREPAVWKPPNF